MVEVSVLVGVAGAVAALASGLFKKYRESKSSEQLVITVRDSHGHESTLVVPPGKAKNTVGEMVHQLHKATAEEQTEAVPIARD